MKLGFLTAPSLADKVGIGSAGLLYGGGPARDANTPRPRNHMLLTNPVIEVEGDRAQAHVVWTGISHSFSPVSAR